MKPLAYDKKVVAIIKSLREINRVKQSAMAKALKMKIEDYLKIEKNQEKITPGQLKIIAKKLKTSHFQILALADYEADPTQYVPTSFSEILIKFVLSNEKRNSKVTFSKQERDFVISKIDAMYTEMNKRKNKIND